MYHVPIGPFHCGKLKKNILTAHPELQDESALSPK